MRIACLGISHRTAPVQLREKLALNSSRAVTILRKLHDRWADASFAILSTCNRTELYVVRRLHAHPREDALRSLFARWARTPRTQLDPQTYYYVDSDASRHLFCVAAGLDSLVPGEAQIVSQVKQAYSISQKTGCSGKYLNTLFQTALRVAKHVRSQTPISKGSVSIPSVAIDAVTSNLAGLSEKSVLCIGAGKIGASMLHHLRELNVTRIGICNRTTDKAHQLASDGDEVIPYRRRSEWLAHADIVICSTGSKRNILTRDMIRKAQQHRKWKPLLVLDLAVPRDVDASAASFKHVRVLNIDDLEDVVKQNIALRKSHITSAKDIIERYVADVEKALRLRKVIPTIGAMYSRMDQLAAQELQRARQKLSTHADFEEDEEIVRQALHRIVRRFLHPAAKELRKSAGTHQAKSYVDALRELFELDIDE